MILRDFFEGGEGLGERGGVGVVEEEPGVMTHTKIHLLKNLSLLNNENFALTSWQWLASSLFFETMYNNQPPHYTTILALLHCVCFCTIGMQQGP